MRKATAAIIIVGVLLAACGSPGPAPTPTATPLEAAVEPTATAPPTSTVAPSATPTVTPANEGCGRATTEIPEGHNPTRFMSSGPATGCYDSVGGFLDDIGLSWEEFAPGTVITFWTEWPVDAQGAVVYPTPTPSPTPTRTVSPLVESTLQPGRVVEHPPTQANPYTFYSYFPRSAVRKVALTVAVWPHGGGMCSEDYSVHRTQSYNTLQWLAPYAEQYQMPVVVVAMPRVDRLYVHSLHPGTFTTGEEMLRRPDLKLIDAVWNQYLPSLRAAGLAPDSQVYFMGFSSTGMFSHRFTMLHPERVRAVWLGADAPAPLPSSELDGHRLDYPLGMANVESLTGRPFDFEAYRAIPHFICVGERDVNPNNDTTTYTDIFTEEERLFIKSRFGATNPDRITFFYEYLVSVGVPAEFRLYAGLGHEVPPQMLQDAFAFLTAH